MDIINHCPFLWPIMANRTVCVRHPESRSKASSHMNVYFPRHMKTHFELFVTFNNSFSSFAGSVRKPSSTPPWKLRTDRAPPSTSKLPTSRANVRLLRGCVVSPWMGPPSVSFVGQPVGLHSHLADLGRTPVSVAGEAADSILCDPRDMFKVWSQARIQVSLGKPMAKGHTDHSKCACRTAKSRRLQHVASFQEADHAPV